MCTIKHVINHQAGLAKVKSENFDIYDYLNWDKMIDFMAECEPSHIPGTKTEYHPINYAWLIGGLLESIFMQFKNYFFIKIECFYLEMTNKKFDECLNEWIIKELELENELFIGIPQNMLSDRLAEIQDTNKYEKHNNNNNNEEELKCNYYMKN